MGQMFDYLDDRATAFGRESRLRDLAKVQAIWDVAHGVRPGSNKTCRSCGRDSLYWQRLGGSYELYDGRDGSIHKCPG